jgi:hypothetical protein
LGVRLPSMCWTAWGRPTGSLLIFTLSSLPWSSMIRTQEVRLRMHRVQAGRFN